MKGKVENVSVKNMGILVDDIWYNACDKAKEKITPSLKGCVVEFEPDKNKNFTELKILAELTYDRKCFILGQAINNTERESTEFEPNIFEDKVKKRYKIYIELYKKLQR